MAKQLPTDLDGFHLLKYAVFDKTVVRTGNTRHIVPGTNPEPDRIAICKSPDDESYYLFYCDSQWNVITDTLHQTVEIAEQQAEFEFKNVELMWQSILRD